MEHVSQSGEEKHPYHSQVRQRQAEETRGHILVAARELFESRGYAVTTLEAIAELTEVSSRMVTAPACVPLRDDLSGEIDRKKGCTSWISPINPTSNKALML